MMESVLSDVKISRITIGPDPKNGMTYAVDQPIHLGTGKDRVNCTVTRIVRSETDFHMFGTLCFVIWAQRKDTGEEFVFKYTMGMPVYVTGVAPNTPLERIVDKQFVNYENA